MNDRVAVVLELRQFGSSSVKNASRMVGAISNLLYDGYVISDGRVRGMERSVISWC